MDSFFDGGRRVSELVLPAANITTQEPTLSIFLDMHTLTERLYVTSPMP